MEKPLTRNCKIKTPMIIRSEARTRRILASIIEKKTVFPSFESSKNLI
jgi:hypothetical protein